MHQAVMDDWYCMALFFMLALLEAGVALKPGGARESPSKMRRLWQQK